MGLRLAAIVVLVSVGVWLRMGRRLDDRRAVLFAVTGAAAGALLAAISMAADGVDPVDLYLVAGLAALAIASRDAKARGAMGTALALLGLVLAAAGLGGVAPAAGLSLGPAVLALTIAAGSGALAALAVGRVVRTGPRPTLLLGAALVGLFCLHPPGEAYPDWWGVWAGLRIGGESVYLFAPAELGQLGQPMIVSRGLPALLGLTALLPLAISGLSRARIPLLHGAAALLVLASAILLAVGGLVVGVGAETTASLVDWTAAGLLVPPASSPVFLDLATLLPALSAFALAIGLFADAAIHSDRVVDPTDQLGAADLDVAVALGALLLATLIGVWRELWGTGLGEGSAPLLAAAAVALIGLRLGLPSIRAGALGAAILLLVGASQLPAGTLPGLL